MDRVILQAQDVRKEYFRKGRKSARYFDAVPHMSFELARGELVALVGRSGSGKSTLLGMLGGLLEPTEGQVILDGINLHALSDEELSRMRNERIGYVPQGQTAIYSLSAVRNVMLPYALYHDEKATEEREGHAMELFAKLGIAALADSFPVELSGGEMRRMAIARALINEPDVILADEPTGDLDDENTQVVLQLLRDEASRGAAVLVATHEPKVMDLADRVVSLEASERSASLV